MKKGLLKFCIVILLGFISTIIVGTCDTPKYSLLFLLPSSFVVCSFVFINELDLFGKSIAATLLIALLFIKNIITPIFMALGNGAFNSSVDVTPYMPMAIFLEIFEEITVFLTLKLYRKKLIVTAQNENTNIEFNRYNIRVFGIFTAIITLLVIAILIRYPQLVYYVTIGVTGDKDKSIQEAIIKSNLKNGVPSMIYYSYTYFVNLLRWTIPIFVVFKEYVNNKHSEFKKIIIADMPGEFVWNRKEHGWESDKKNGGVSVRVEFMVDTDISKDKKLMDVMPVSDLKDELNLEETPIVTGECADIISDYINVSHKVQEIYRQYQIYQEALGEWIHYDLDEDNHLVKKYSGAVIDKVTVNKMTKNILHEGMLLVRKAGAFVQKLGLQNETDFLADSMGDNLGFEFMVLAAIYMDHGHWAVEFENGDSFYNLLEMCTVLRTADEEDSADLLKTFTLLKNEMEEQGMDIRHIDHYNMLRNYIYTVADIYKIFFDAIQKKLEAMVVEIDSLVDKNPDFIATEGKFKGCIFYQTDTDSNRVDVFDPSGNIMADFSIFQNEAIRNYEKTRLGIQGAVEHN